ncbi:hypothetical protein KJ765_05350 [Candidatus Micrarchaeota archaeon]|nr:hypothetical protein [Candidatus Micrarchaeota archaeon]
MNTELVGQLRTLGLNQYEAQAYLALTQGGPKSAGEVADIGNIARPRVYDVLDKLQQKGFASLKSGRPVKYAAMPLEEAITTLKKHKEDRLMDEISKIDEMSGRLAKQLSTSGTSKRYNIEENVWTLRGRNAIYSRLAQMVDRSKHHVILSSPPDNIARKINDNLPHFEKAKNRGVKVHVLSPISKLLDKRHALHSPNSHVSKIVTTLMDRHVPTRMILTDDEAMLFLTNDHTLPEDEVGLWIKNPHISSTLKELTLAKK